MDSIHVYVPRRVIFLCGGQISAAAPSAVSLRDAFLRTHHSKPDRTYDVICAEDLNAQFPNGTYRDILEFESDLAQLSELILLFSESFGSAAELGSFVLVPEIARRLLVVIDDRNYEQDSFVRLGPLRYLEHKYSESAICVVYRNELKFNHIGDISGLDLELFSRQVDNAISSRVAELPSSTTFDPNIRGHVIKLIVGFIQHYGALTIKEIGGVLKNFNIMINDDEIKNYLLCADFLRWLRKERRGVNNFYTATDTNLAIGYRKRPDVPFMDRKRWRAQINEYWRSTDPQRFASIQSVLGQPVA